MRRAILPVLVLLALVTSLPAAALATGVAMGPTTLDIPNAVRGGEYESTVFVSNPDDAEAVYALRTEGEAGAWISLYDWDTRQAVRSLTVPGRGSATILVRLKVPADAANGSYGAAIYAETAPTAGAGGGASVVLQGKSVLTVTVSDVQTVSGTVVHVAARDIEAGLPLRLEVVFRNTGNVRVTPAIDCTVSQDGAKIAGFTHAGTGVTAGTQEVIRLEWADTANLKGDYVSVVKVLLDGQVVDTREVPFKVLPAGTLTKTGEFVGLACEGQPAVDTTLKMQGSFKATGQADCRAKLVLEVYRDGALLEALESDEALVPVGQTSVLTAYLKLTRGGDYAVKGHVAYDGKVSETRDVSFTAAGGSSGLGGWLPFVIAGIGGGLAIGAVALLLMRRRRPAVGARKRQAAAGNGKRYAS